MTSTSRSNADAYGSTSTSVRNVWKQLLDEVRATRHEVRVLREEQKKNTILLQKLQENTVTVSKELEKMQEKTFAVQGSDFQHSLNRELAALFCVDIGRQPPNTKISEVIVKVLREESRNRHKFNMTRAYCNQKLTDFRCEERRRILGIKPCAQYKDMTTDDFAERYMTTIKAPFNVKEAYIKNLVVLRKFCREIGDAKDDTYQRFRQWIDATYPNGLHHHDISKMMEEDMRLSSSSGHAEQGDFTSDTQSPSLSTPPTISGSPVTPLPPLPI